MSAIPRPRKISRPAPKADDDEYDEPAPPPQPISSRRGARQGDGDSEDDGGYSGASAAADLGSSSSSAPVPRPSKRSAAAIITTSAAVDEDGAGGSAAGGAGPTRAKRRRPLPAEEDEAGAEQDHDGRMLSSSSAAAAGALSTGVSQALVPAANQSSALAGRPVMGFISRPVALTKHGIRQYVETEHGVRLFLQNAVATVDLKCRPDLPHVASHARNAEYNPRRFSAVILRLREPAKATALLFGTGKLCLTGVKCEDDAKYTARKVAKIVQKLGFNAGFADFKIQNLVASGDVGFPIRLEGIADEHAGFASYEPELFPGLIYRMENPRVVLLIFVSGKICITGARTRSDIVRAVTNLHPVLHKYRKRDFQLPVVGGAGAGAGAAGAGAGAGAAMQALPALPSSSSSSSSSAAAGAGAGAGAGRGAIQRPGRR